MPQGYFMPGEEQYLNPDRVAKERALAEKLLAEASGVEPLGHWTQALAKVLSGVIQGSRLRSLAKAEREGTAAANEGFNKVLTELLKGGSEVDAPSAGTATGGGEPPPVKMVPGSQPLLPPGPAIPGDRSREIGPPPPQSAMEAYDRAIASIETPHVRDPYRAKGKVIDNPKSMYFGDRAHGIHQVMGKNIPDWTEAAIGRRMTPAEFTAPGNEWAQHAVFKDRFGRSLRKYGDPSDAASVWFTGQPVSRGLNADDGNLTGGRYVAQFLANLGEDPYRAPEGVDVSVGSPNLGSGIASILAGGSPLDTNGSIPLVGPDPSGVVPAPEVEDAPIPMDGGQGLYPTGRSPRPERAALGEPYGAGSVGASGGEVGYLPGLGNIPEAQPDMALLRPAMDQGAIYPGYSGQQDLSEVITATNDTPDDSSLYFDPDAMGLQGIEKEVKRAKPAPGVDAQTQQFDYQSILRVMNNPWASPQQKAILGQILADKIKRGLPLTPKERLELRQLELDIKQKERELNTPIEPPRITRKDGSVWERQNDGQWAQVMDADPQEHPDEYKLFMQDMRDRIAKINSDFRDDPVGRLKAIKALPDFDTWREPQRKAEDADPKEWVLWQLYVEDQLKKGAPPENIPDFLQFQQLQKGKGITVTRGEDGSFEIQIGGASDSEKSRQFIGDVGQAYAIDAGVTAATNILRIMDEATLPATGTFSELLGLVDFTSAGELRGWLEGLTSGVAIQTIERLKKASKNGATGFGALSERELDQLIGIMGTLKAGGSSAPFRDSVERILDMFQHIDKALKYTVDADEINAMGYEDLFPHLAGISERDISEYMKKHNVTRRVVIDNLIAAQEIENGRREN